MKAWTGKDIEDLRRLYPTIRTKTCARQMQRSVSSVAAKAKKLKLSKGTRHVWTAAEIRAVRKRYPHECTKLIAADLGIELGMVYRKAKRLGLVKTEAYLASPAACRLRRGDEVGKAYRFPKGIVPANKGLRRPGYAPGNMASTQFKKGQMSGAAQHNYVPIGTLRISKDGYLERKVTDDPNVVSVRRWKGVHVLLWEEHLGPVPAGHCVCFKDGDKKHVAIDNLALISRAERMRRNSFRTRYPKAVQDVIVLRGAVNRQINRRARNEQHDPRP